MSLILLFSIACLAFVASMMLFLIRRTTYYVCVWLPLVTNLTGWICYVTLVLLQMPQDYGRAGPAAPTFPPAFLWLLLFGPIYIALLVALCAAPPLRAWKLRYFAIGTLASLILGSVLVWKLGPIVANTAHYLFN